MRRLLHCDFDPALKYERVSVSVKRATDGRDADMPTAASDADTAACHIHIAHKLKIGRRRDEERGRDVTRAP